jgi:ferric-dicitrate binding protein FerR (iron transport regulator)
VTYRDEKSIQLLGNRLGKIQDTLLAEDSSDRFQAGYRRFISAIDRDRSLAHWRTVVGWAAGLSAAACAAFALWVSAPFKPPTLSFNVGDQHTQGIVGEWITAPGDKGVPVLFSDGTRVELDPYTRARIGLYDERAGRVILESGSARLKVVHRDGVQWRVDAGPFAVRVTGTTFDLTWKPESQLFEINLREGSVTVDGPVLDQGRNVRKGQTLRVSVTRSMALLAETSSMVASRDWPTPSAEQPRDDRQESASNDASNGVSENRPVARTDASDARWKELAEEGRYEEALAAAENRGFTRLCNRLGPASLLRLAEVARFAGRLDRTEQALRQVRERFSKRREAAIAAYTLGRAAFDQKGSYGEAEKWFEVYLREQPSGALAREALGRLMEAQSHQGRHDRAKQTARRYLDRFPNGPHTDIAARLVAE